ncbi:neuraminidase-like domain-containing protein [Burkholderia sp. S-53]|uniref:Tc toxin subunit A-related protein n=1 Tax=Burkholderia sp. S-53 TaxID=2906514 RepID=UPI0021D3B252|nr:neuraminidase-like domain-containing protein [Burkholderia sp. S-53]UXU86132.1 hypothetical protein LXM88_02325 [Burkholderia sp. S-53]
MSNYVETYNQLMESRRNAYVPAYITYCIPDTKVNGVSLNDTIKTVNELYEYLLIDPMNTSQVDTTMIGATISSLQMYINECISGAEPEVNNAPGSTMVDQSRAGGFLYDWKSYNQAYSTWSAKERLQYYASNYIAPDLRQNKTPLFDDLSQNLSQGKMNLEKTEQAFTTYVTGFEELANLQTISGYLAGFDVSEESHDTIYFVGRTNSEPCKYYMRSCDMASRSENKKISSTAWSGWEEISAPIASPINDFVSCARFNSRPHACWISSAINGQSKATNDATLAYSINIYAQCSDKSWSSYRQIPIPALATGYLPNRVWCANYLAGSYALFLELSGGSGKKLFATFDQIDWEDITGDVANIPDGFIFRDVGYSTPKLFRVGEKFLVNNTLCEVENDNPDKFSMTIITSLSSMTYTLINEYLINIITKTAQRSSSNSFALDYSSDPPTYGIAFAGSNNPDYRIWVKLPNVTAYRSKWLRSYFGIDAPYFKFSRYLLEFMPKVGASAAPLAQTSTNSGPFFYATLENGGINRLLSYATQTFPIETPDGPTGPSASINFNSAYGLYFWELFFYAPFLIADRYLVQQDYDNAALWYQYIFSNAGYRNEAGKLETIGDDNEVRYWNVVPLQQDDSWNEVIPPTLDPNAIGMNDPMQFKMAIFLRTVEMLIQCGDHYYRQLDREALTRARMYYLNAAELLGPRPTIDYNDSWPDPTIGDEAGQLVVFNADDPDATSSTWMSQALLAWLEGQNGNFLPPYNEELLHCWDTLELRFYNLRHNLSINGRPLSLPMYAEPLSPTELQLRSSAGTGPGVDTMPQAAFECQFRFQFLLDQAKYAAGNVVQFGASLLGTLEKGNNEAMTLLLQTQQKSVLTQMQSIQNTNLSIQENTLTSTNKAKEAAQKRLEYYDGLLKEGWTADERNSINLSYAATSANYVSVPLLGVATGLCYIPTIFGLADGGAQPGMGMMNAAFSFQALAQSLQMTSGNLGQVAAYDRRTQEWQMQKENSSLECEQLDAQIAAQSQQIEMARKQIALNDLERANQDTVYNFLRTRFTGQPLYNWMTARLSALYYQLYDVTLELCLTAKRALAREIGAKNADQMFTAPMWNDLYQGLLAGEGLLLELQRMENAWLKFNTRGLEIQRTASLNTLLVASNPARSLSSAISQALAAAGSPQPPAPNSSGVSVVFQSSGVLRIELDIASLKLAEACNSTGSVGRFYSISVTLPTLLGPYQDVNATLELASDSQAAIPEATIAVSRGLDDMGIFVSDANGARYLPFEGMSTERGTLILNIYQVKVGEPQRALVERLTDVIYQLRYTLKDE